ncbi:MAG: hypothetical protein PVG30_00005 [Gammaproteobacteria bacterium]|jgi:hypothetical protein
MQLKKIEASKYLCIIKFFIFAIAVYTLGVPIVEPWKAIALFAFAVFLVYADDFNLSKFSRAITIGVIILLLIIKCFIPAINIQEGHNYYVPKSQDLKVQYNALPKNILQELRKDFFRYYPRKNWCDKDTFGCWRYFYASPIPSSTFAFSADGFWQSPKYSRVVHAINFSSLATFRGGFVNDLSKNWYSDISDLKRFNMPFFVMYEIPDSLVNCKFCWRGKIFWQQPNGKFKLIFAENSMCRKILPKDIGKKIFGISFPGKNDLNIHIIPNWQMMTAHSVKNILSILVLVLLLSFFQNNWKKSGVFLLWSLLACIAEILYTFYHQNNFFYFSTLVGGDDGLTYQGMARIMLYHLKHGHFIKMLAGAEPIFYYMPGMRYFVMLGKLIFGDTNLALSLIALSYVGITWEFLRKLFDSTKISICVFLPLIFFSIRLFHLAGHGMSEPVAMVLLLLGIIQLLNYHANRTSIQSAWLASLFFGLTAIIRPNFAIMMCAGMFFAALDLLMQGKIFKIVKMYSGFFVVLFLPLHNLFFGHQLVLLTSSALHPSNYMASPMDYYYALVNLFTHTHSHAYARVAKQLYDWLGLFGILPLLLLPIIFVYMKDFKVRLLILMALGAHLIMLFWEADAFRYQFPAWLLTSIVIIKASINLYKHRFGKN